MFKKGDLVVSTMNFLDNGENLKKTLGIVIQYYPQNDYMVLGVINPQKYTIPPQFPMRGKYYRHATIEELKKWEIK